MPLYEYKCEKCAHRFEKIEPMSASTTKKCPKCGAKAQRMVAAPAIQFKGSGWYVTDYAKKSHAPASDSGGKDSKESKKEDAKKDDKKPESSSKESTTKKGDKHK